MMKLAMGTALLVLLAGATVYAQEQDKEKPAQREEKKQEPAAKEHERPQAQEQQQKTQRQTQEQQKTQAKQTEKEKSDAAKHQQQESHQQQQQAARQDRTQNQQAQRDGGNRNARHINEQEFHQHFGREHTFRVARSEDRRFSYGGYYWVYNDPWPSDWAYTDAVYVDEIDGEYYLIDPVHPGLRLLIVIAD